MVSRMTSLLPTGRVMPICAVLTVAEFVSEPNEWIGDERDEQPEYESSNETCRHTTPHVCNEHDQ